jgi:hypothetical protein
MSTCLDMGADRRVNDLDLPSLDTCSAGVVSPHHGEVRVSEISTKAPLFLVGATVSPAAMGTRTWREAADKFDRRGGGRACRTAEK